MTRNSAAWQPNELLTIFLHPKYFKSRHRLFARDDSNHKALPIKKNILGNTAKTNT